MKPGNFFLAMLAIASIPVVSCGRADDGSVGLSPASNYREQQLDRALAGVTVVDGLIVPEPAPALSEAAVRSMLTEVEALLDEGRRPDAIERAVAAVRGAPGSPIAFAALGRALLTTPRTGIALAAFATAVARGPDDADLHFFHGLTLDRCGRRAEAVAAWRWAIDLDPGHGSAHARLAAAAWLTGDLEGARHHLSKAVDLGAPVPAQLAEMVAAGRAPSARVVAGRPAGEAAGMTDAIFIGPQVRLNPTLGSVRANETSAAAGHPGEVVASWNDYSAGGTIRTGVSVSLDGETWADQVVRAPAANQSGVEGDPMTAADPRTGTVWVGAISFDSNGGAFVARKQPGTAIFDAPVLTLASGVADKGWMAAGPRPGLPDTTRLYLAYNHGLQFSDDLGASWSPPLSLGSGIGFLPRVGPDGTVYVSYWNYGDGHILRRSFDGGQSMTAPVRITTLLDFWDVGFSPQIPGEFRVPQLASLAVDPVDGTLFCVYFDTSGVAGSDADVDLWLTRSDDGGDSWTVPVVISADPDPPGDQFFPWLEIDASGRLHLLYFDTGLTAQNDSAVNAWIDAFYASSGDRGATWTTHRLTGSSFDSALTDLGNGQFIGDYNGMAVVGDRVWPVYLSTEFGVQGVYSHEIRTDSTIFSDDFESGDTSAWSATGP